MPRTVLWALALVISASCVSPPPDVDAVPNFDADTYMGLIQERGVLRVGVPESAPEPFVFRRESALGWQGFVVNLSGELARGLGVDLEVVSAPEEGLVTYVEDGPDEGTLQTEGGEELDLAFPLEPITESLARRHPITNPYWVGHQRLLVPANSEVEDISNLAGDTVCTILDPETGVEPEALDPHVRSTTGDTAGCTKALRNGDVAAVTAVDITLMAIQSKLDPCLPDRCGGDPPSHLVVSDDITTEGFGAVTPLRSSGWKRFIDSTWGEMKSEGRWLRSYRKWILPYLNEDAHAPEMTVQEAAGLYPRER